MWLPPQLEQHVGAPPLSPATAQGPSYSATTTVNPLLKPIAAAEASADAKAGEAHALAQQAMAAHDGYPAAFAAIGAATGAWRSVQRLAGKLASSQGATPDALQAKVAVPGIVASAQHELEDLLALHHALRADQEAKRPDLPPAARVPDESTGLGWGGLAIAGGIVYLLWKAVF